MHEAAIGVFDSGVGGLTVVRALRALLPRETILYLGDTARVPYGTKSAETVERYALEALAFLEVAAEEFKQRQRQSSPPERPAPRILPLKLVVVACNTVSAVALDALRARSSVPVIGVVHSAVQQALLKTTSQRIAVMGTEGTIRSGAYQRILEKKAPGVEVIGRPCNVLVSHVEEGWLDHPSTRLALESYIGDLPQHGVGALILGCTHYPLLAETIDRLFDGQLPLVDPSQSTAQEVLLLLQKRGWLNPSQRDGDLLCFVTDAPQRFRAIASQFLGEPVDHVEQVELVRFVGGQSHDHWV